MTGKLHSDYYWDGHSVDMCEEWSRCVQHRDLFRINDEATRKQIRKSEEDSGE